MSISGYFPLQFQLRPAELTSGLDIPCPLLEGQLRLQNNCVLRPANRHSLSHHPRRIFIGAVKLPHPAKVPGGEAGDARVRAGQVLCGGDSGAFFRPAADQPANLTVQIHLRQVCRHQGVQRRKHGAVVYGFSDVHPSSSFPARVRLFYSLHLKSPTSKPSASFSEGLPLSGIRSYRCYSRRSSTICSHWTMKRSSTTQFRW